MRMRFCAVSSRSRQHFLYFLPLLQWQGSFRPSVPMVGMILRVARIWGCLFHLKLGYPRPEFRGRGKHAPPSQDHYSWSPWRLECRAYCSAEGSRRKRRFRGVIPSFAIKSLWVSGLGCYQQMTAGTSQVTSSKQKHPCSTA